MYPHERSLIKQLAGKPFAVIGVNSDPDLEKLREIVKKKKLTWRSFQNEEGADGKISEEWGIKGWPTMFVIDAKGVIRWSGHGGDFDSVIEEALGEMGHEVSIKSIADIKEEAEAKEAAEADEADAEATDADDDNN